MEPSRTVGAHRGASGYAPENTWPAFLLACEMGAGGIETDVQVSKDGVLVLFHDTKVDRTTDGSGTVGNLTWAELSRLDAGNWLDARFGGERIVRLDAFLDWRFPRHRLASLGYPPGSVYGPGDVIGPGAARTSGGTQRPGEDPASGFGRARGSGRPDRPRSRRRALHRHRDVAAKSGCQVARQAGKP